MTPQLTIINRTFEKLRILKISSQSGPEIGSLKVEGRLRTVQTPGQKKKLQPVPNYLTPHTVPLVYSKFEFFRP